MDYLTFAKEKPVLYGQIVANNRVKIGAFKPIWDHFTNSSVYHYFTPKNRKGKGGFTMIKAWKLLESGSLSTDPEMGKPESYL